MIFLSIGSSLSSPFGDRFENINKCISLLLSNKVKPLQVSDFYESISYPDKKNPKFINIILIVKFNGTPNSLLRIIIAEFAIFPILFFGFSIYWVKIFFLSICIIPQEDGLFVSKTIIVAKHDLGLL